jgi:hypothetical protein
MYLSKLRYHWLKLGIFFLLYAESNSTYAKFKIKNCDKFLGDFASDDDAHSIVSIVIFVIGAGGLISQLVSKDFKPDFKDILGGMLVIGLAAGGWKLPFQYAGCIK